MAGVAVAAATAGGGLSGAELAAELVEEGLASLRAGRAAAATQLGDADRLLRQVCPCLGRAGHLPVIRLCCSSSSNIQVIDLDLHFQTKSILLNPTESLTGPDSSQPNPYVRI